MSYVQVLHDAAEIFETIPPGFMKPLVYLDGNVSPYSLAHTVYDEYYIVGNRLSDLPEGTATITTEEGVFPAIPINIEKLHKMKNLGT